MKYCVALGNASLLSIAPPRAIEQQLDREIEDFSLEVASRISKLSY